MDASEILVPHAGWREVARMPESVSWARLRRHLGAWPEARLIDTVCNLLTEATLDFTFGVLRFRIDEKEGRYRLFVEERPNEEPETTRRAAAAVEAVEAYCRQLLAPAP